MDTKQLLASMEKKFQSLDLIIFYLPESPLDPTGRWKCQNIFSAEFFIFFFLMFNLKIRVFFTIILTQIIENSSLVLPPFLINHDAHHCDHPLFSSCW